jgi:hypothetical protein
MKNNMILVLVAGTYVAVSSLRVSHSSFLARVSTLKESREKGSKRKDPTDADEYSEYREPERTKQELIFRTLKLIGNEAGRTEVDIDGEMDMIFDGAINLPGGHTIDVFFNPASLVLEGDKALGTTASNYETVEKSRISWEGAPSLTMKPLLSTLDSGNREVCDNNEVVCHFMEPIMLFDIHSWATTQCVQRLDQTKLKTLSAYDKFELMRENCKDLLKPARAHKGQAAQTFMTNFGAAKELIEKEHRALKENGGSLLQRYNEVAIRLWPWDIVGIEVGSDSTNAKSLRGKLDGKRKELKDKLIEFSREPHQAGFQNNDKNIKIFLKFLEHQHSGWVKRHRNEAPEKKAGEENILNQVPKDVWSFLLHKIIARLEAPLKMLHYDINSDFSFSRLVENPPETLEHNLRGLQQEKINGLFNVYPKSVRGI